MIKQKLDLLLNEWAHHTDDCSSCAAWDNDALLDEELRPCDRGREIIGRMAMHLGMWFKQ